MTILQIFSISTSTLRLRSVSPLFLACFLSGRISQIAFPETLFLDYRHFDQKNITPRYDFGFGLSYTIFSYSNLNVSPSGSGATVSFTVSNTGSRDGTEIPQMYIGFPSGTGEPPKVLRGFDEVVLAQGASQSVTFALDQRDLRCEILLLNFQTDTNNM